MSSTVLWVLQGVVHVILETGRDVARLQESSISINVVGVPREVIHLVETLVLQYCSFWSSAGYVWSRDDNDTSGLVSWLSSEGLGQGHGVKVRRVRSFHVVVDDGECCGMLTLHQMVFTARDPSRLRAWKMKKCRSRWQVSWAE